MTPRATTLSAIVITRNEAHNLDDCLTSLKGWVDEIVVVDSHSTDDTVAIALRHGAKVAQPDGWPGFGPQIVPSTWRPAIGCCPSTPMNV